jgi:DNA-binding NarL/FixJ family response regulator
MSIRVLIADDHELVRQGLGAMIATQGFNVVAEAANGHDAVTRSADARPDVAVLDMSMPIMNGIDAAQAITRQTPATRVVVLSRHDSAEYVLAALRAGIKGYVLKSQSTGELIDAMHDVCAGGFYLSPGISHVVVDAFRSNETPQADPLTCRERQILKLVAEGYSTKECAALLGVAVKTADSHRTRLMRKLGIHGTAGLVRYAVRHHLSEV